MDANLSAVGLLFAGSAMITIYNHIGDVETVLGVRPWLPAVQLISNDQSLESVKPGKDASRNAVPEFALLQTLPSTSFFGFIAPLRFDTST
jgi:hypothetical protein